MQILEFDEEALVYIALVFDGNNKKVLGNFMGLYGIPARGGRYWWAVNGDSGYCDSDKEAQHEIKQAWK